MRRSPATPCRRARPSRASCRQRLPPWRPAPDLTRPAAPGGRARCQRADPQRVHRRASPPSRTTGRERAGRGAWSAPPPRSPGSRRRAPRCSSLYRTYGFVLTTVTATVWRPTATCGSTSSRGGSPRSSSTAISARPACRCCASSTTCWTASRSTTPRWSAGCCWRRTCPASALHAVLQPSLGDPGALTLVAQVQRQMVNGLLTADNRAFRSTGPVEGLLIVRPQQLHVSSARRPSCRSTIPTATRRISARPRPSSTSAARGSRSGSMAATARPSRRTSCATIGYRGFTTTVRRRRDLSADPLAPAVVEPGRRTSTRSRPRRRRTAGRSASRSARAATRCASGGSALEYATAGHAGRRRAAGGQLRRRCGCRRG